MDKAEMVRQIVSLGTDLVDIKAIGESNVDIVTERARQYVAIVKEAFTA